MENATQEIKNNETGIDNEQEILEKARLISEKKQQRLNELGLKLRELVTKFENEEKCQILAMLNRQQLAQYAADSIINPNKDNLFVIPINVYPANTFKIQ